MSRYSHINNSILYISNNTEMTPFLAMHRKWESNITVKAINEVHYSTATFPDEIEIGLGVRAVDIGRGLPTTYH